MQLEKLVTNIFLIVIKLDHLEEVGQLILFDINKNL